MMNEPVKSIMMTELFTMGPEDTLGKAREILGTYRVHHIPIVDNEKLVGLITTWDLFKMDMSPNDYASIPVKNIMTTHLAVLGPDDKVGSASELFLEHMFQAIPVVDADRKLMGLVTMFDVLRYSFYKEYDH